jgi:chromosomal replication initiator protein
LDLPAHQLWQAALSELQGTVSRSSFDNWIRPARLIEVGPDAATLRADNPQVATTLRNRFADDIGRVLSNLVGRPLDVVVTIAEPDGRNVPPAAVTRTSEPVARQLTLTANSGLNPRYIFDTYIVGSSNRFAHAASLAGAAQPGSH